MTIDVHVRKAALTGLAFALNHVRPGAALVGEWLLEQKAVFERCGAFGACWKHGVDHGSLPAMAAEAVRGGTSMYDITECHAEKGEIYFDARCNNVYVF